MRIIVGGGWLLIPVLVGCNTFRGKRDDSTKGDVPTASRPFTGAPTDRLPERRDPAASLPSTETFNGVLAGYVRDTFNKPMSNGFIQVVDLAEPSSKTKIDLAVDNQGQFVIPRLTPGHSYKLIARVRDGTRFMAGTVQATPPNPKIAIIVSEDLVGPDTPPLPGPPSLPGRATEPAERDVKPQPSAGLGTPTRPRNDVPTDGDPRSIGQPPIVVPGGPIDKTNIADEGGFRRVRPDSPTVDLPNPAARDTLPPPPQFPAPREREPNGPRMPPVGNEADPVPGTTPPVPSCVLIGKKLENFALYGLDGKPWEFRKDHKGKLVLLQFWSSTSAESLGGLAALRDLHTRYEPFGLQIIGIAYEEGAFAQQVQNVMSARGRYTIKYVTLLGGGGPGPCPVREQFLVDHVPELVLMGGDNQIIWRSHGAPDADKLVELRLVITRWLRVNEPNQP